MEEANARFADPAMDLENMVPKKPNWDLKRAISPQIEALQRQTKQALLEIAQQRAMASGTGEDLASTVKHAAEVPSSEEEDEEGGALQFTMQV